MKIFLAGGTGVIGRPLISVLCEAGHEVTAMTRSEKGEALLAQLGATPVRCDVFDAQQLQKVMVEAQPEVVIHQLTSIPDKIDPRHVMRDLALTPFHDLERWLCP